MSNQSYYIWSFTDENYNPIILIIPADSIKQARINLIEKIKTFKAQKIEFEKTLEILPDKIDDILYYETLCKNLKKMKQFEKEYQKENKIWFEGPFAPTYKTSIIGSFIYEYKSFTLPEDLISNVEPKIINNLKFGFMSALDD